MDSKNIIQFFKELFQILNNLLTHLQWKESKSVVNMPSAIRAIKFTSTCIAKCTLYVVQATRGNRGYENLLLKHGFNMFMWTKSLRCITIGQTQSSLKKNEVHFQSTVSNFDGIPYVELRPGIIQIYLKE